MIANELRTGNYVYDTLGKVNKIDLEAITYIVKEPHNQVKPIPLTEEWLLKFGFKKVEGLPGWTYDGYDIFKDGKSWHIFKFNQTLKVHRCKLLYVHQLQNLYFALTGKELTFKSE